MADIPDPGKPLAKYLYLHQGKVYLIRSLYVGSKFLTREYGVLTEDLQLAWRSVRDGDVPWNEIEPLGEVEPCQ